MRSSVLAALAILLMTIATAMAAGPIEIAGGRLLRDGAPWLAKGVTVVGLLPPAPSPYPAYAAAAAHWGPAELAAIRAFGADTIRLQVSQPGLDPRSPAYVPAYLARVVSAGRLVRESGFSLILSMQSRGTAGVADPPTMPDAATARAWAALAPQFAGDAGTMLELFNEPVVKLEPPFTPEKFQVMWAQWRDGHQRLIDQLRAAGSHNVLILDGAQTANFLNDVPAMADPLNRLAYAVHPYFTAGTKGAATWQSNFGAFAATHPVIVSEWDMDSAVGCVPDGPALASALVAWLRARGIGLVGWAFDMPGSIVQDFSFTPTTFTDFHCGKQGHGGAGQLISAAFHAPG